ncbi:solute carrier family 35 member F2-like [Panicum miliaceum]|uniref:Solute carrier family 35 member F2-like n=1 Tax=Panicum miliaceum TaxID=4540 RepID=A0A3L6REH9_PANMI|nr:solute carrier family 35 member F2-like [Panicum miliaceum]
MGVKKKAVWGLLLLGQIISFSVAASSFASSLIANLGVNAPLTQLLFAYLLLTIVYVSIILHRREKLQIAWYWYLALAFIDVQGNYLGACVAGLALALLSDAKSPDEQDPGKIPLLGDALVIAGTVCYAFNNVGQEYCVKNKDRVEIVAMLGLFGSLVSVVQMYPLHNSLLVTD